MKCPQCGSGLPDDVRICPECGAPTKQARSNDIPAGAEAETNVLLAQANLSRLRRDYDLAMTQCVEVLRRYPNNASAHSLLGDIYRDQAAYAEALAWYRLALQLDPASVADREKISELEHKLSAAGREGATALPAWRRISSGARAKLPLGLVLGVAVGCVVLAALVVLSIGRDTTRASMFEGMRVPRMLAPPSPEAPLPAQPPARPPEAGEPGMRHVSPTPPAAPAEVKEPVIYTPRERPPQLAPARDVNYTDREQRLLESLRELTRNEDSMLAVDTVVLDPRSEAATLTISVRDVLGSPETRGVVLQKSLRAADLAIMRDEKLARVTVRCQVPMLGANGVQSEQLVFVGDLAAATLKDAVGRELTFDDALRLFAPQPWWHAQMLPSGRR